MICSFRALLRALFAIVLLCGSVGTGAWAAADDVEYRYDELGRLVQVIYWAQNKTHRYSYDGAGNRRNVEIIDDTPNPIRLWKASAMEGDDLLFGVWRKYRSLQDVVVTYETFTCAGAGAATPGPAGTPGADYQGMTGTITITGDNLVGKGAYITVPTYEDTLTEGDEKVCIRLLSATGGEIDPETQTREGKIFDAQSENVAFSVASASGPEGEGVTFTITKTGSHKALRTVRVRTEDVSARAGKDYQPIDETVVFWPNEYKKTITVATLEDDVYEGSESFIVRLSDTSATLAKSWAPGSILDSDQMPRIIVSQSGTREGNTQSLDWVLGHSVWASSEFERNISVDWVLCHAGSGTAGECAKDPALTAGVTAKADDFDAGTVFSGTLTLTPENFDAVLDFHVVSDTVAEADEQYLLKLYNPTNALLDGDRYYGYGNIRNDDGTKSVYNNFGGDTVNAGQPMTFTVRRWANYSEAKTLDFEAADTYSRPNDPSDFQPDRIIAVAGVDYTGGTGTFSFPAVSSSDGQTATFTIQTLPIDPATTPYQGNKILPVQIKRQAGDDGIITVANRYGTIVDPYVPVVNVAPVSALESTGELAFTFTLSRKAAFPISVYYATTLGGSASLEDFEHTSGTLVFPANSISPQTVIVPIIDDNDPDGLEGHETVELALTSEDVQLSTGSVMGTILNDPYDACNSHMWVEGGDETWEDDGGKVITVNMRTGTCPEQFTMLPGGSNFASMAMQGATATTHEYQLELVSGTAEAGEDFQSKSVTIGMTALSGEQRIPLEVIDDLINETNEDLQIRLTPLEAGDLADDDEALIILDNDPGVIFTVDDAEQTEGGSLTFTIRKTGEADWTSSLDYQTQDGTALAAEDYTAVSGTLVFAPNETYRTVTVQTLGNSLFEYGEQLYLNLSNPTGDAAIEDGQAAGMITDNDPAPSFAVTDASAGEGEDLIFTILLDRPSTFEHSVRFTTRSGSAREGEDYLPVGGVLTFTPGQTERQIVVQTADDDAAEGEETFTLVLSGATAGAVIGDQSATLAIEDNDGPPAPAFGYLDETVFDTPGTYQWTAPDGVTSVSVVAVGGGGGGALVGGVTWVSGGGGGLAWKNNIPVVPGQSYTVVVGSGGMGNGGSGGHSYFISATTVKGPGGYTLNNTGSADGTSWGRTSSHGFIGDGGGSGGRGAYSEISWSSLGGGGAGGYTGSGGDGAILLSSSGSANGNPGTGGGGGGGGAASSGKGWGGGGVGLYGESANGSGGTDSVGATGGSGGENATTDRAGAKYGGGAGYTVSSEGRGGDGAVRIMWGDGRSFPNNAGGVTSVPLPAGTLTVDVSEAAQAEGGDLLVTLVASGSATADVVLGYATADGTATAGVDYEAASGTVTFAPGETVKAIRIPSYEDQAQEADEEFTVTLSVVSGLADLPQPSVTATILDDDKIPSFGISETAVEVIGGQPAAFTITKSIASENTYTLSYETVAGTAVENQDYVPTSGTLTFAAGVMAQTVLVETVDSGSSGGGTFMLRLSNPSGGATLGSAEVTAAIFGGAPVGEIIFDTAGTHNWVVPTGVTSVSVVCVGGGGGGGYQNTGEWRSGGGGGLGWKNNVPVTPGETITVAVGAAGYGPVKSVGQGYGGNSYFKDMTTCAGYGGKVGVNGNAAGYVGDGGGLGGISQQRSDGRLGGSGAGGYSGQGGQGSYAVGSGLAKDGQGGAGGGGGDSDGGGGVGLYGEGASGAGSTTGGKGGSGGTDGTTTGIGGQYGGGAAYGNSYRTGGGGAVRVMWGAGRSFPSNAAQEEPSGGMATPAVSQFTISDATVEEGGMLYFTISADVGQSEAVTLDLGFTDGTATNGVDFDGVPQSITFEPNVTSKTIAVATLDDGLAEGDESFTLMLSSSSGMVTFVDAEALATIIDNDVPASIGVGPHGSATVYNASYQNVIPAYRLSNGNLTVTDRRDLYGKDFGTFPMTGNAVSTGKWYWEIRVDVKPSGTNYLTVVAPDTTNWGTDVLYQYIRDSLVGYNAGDTLSVALDMDNRVFWVAVNGVWYGGATLAEIEAGNTLNATKSLSTAGAHRAAICIGNTSANAGNQYTYNFGQTAFQYAPPAGYQVFP